MTTITDGATTIVPTLVLGFSSSRESRNTLTEPIDSPEPYVSLAEARTRTGTFEFLFAGVGAGFAWVDGYYVPVVGGVTAEADSLACELLHASPAVLSLTDTDVPSVSMSYVVNGEVTRALDPETRKVWTVSVPYREVSP